jgi:hypothetical protein
VHVEPAWCAQHEAAVVDVSPRQVYQEREELGRMRPFFAEVGEAVTRYGPRRRSSQRLTGRGVAR